MSNSNNIKNLFLINPTKKILNSKFTHRHLYFFSFTLGLISSVLISFELKFLFILFLWFSFYLYLLGNNIIKLKYEDGSFEFKKEIVLNKIVDSFIIIGFYLIYPEFGIMYLFYLVGILLNFYNSQSRVVVFPNKFENFFIFTLMALFPKFIFFILGLFNLLVFYKGFYSLHKMFFQNEN
jgi:hypothetical protein